MKLVKDICSRTYKDGYKVIILENTEQYHYESEEEKLAHAELMKSKGFEDSGQVKTNIGTILKPNYVWFGNYYKVEEIID